MKLSPNKIIVTVILVLLPVMASLATEIRWKNEKADTLLINNALEASKEKRFEDNGRRVSFFARRFLGTPYVGHTLEGEKEMLTINTSGLDCTTFVDLALALAKTSEQGGENWRQMAKNLENMRYRTGRMTDYASRLHYNSDWAADNILRGNIEDVTPSLPGNKNLKRTLNFMTTHRSLYDALADSTQFAKVAEIEKNYTNFTIPYLPTSSLSNPTLLSLLREGDIIGFAINRNDLDMAHLGILVFEKGVPYILHASSSHGKVEISRLPLQEFVKNNKKWIGIRVFRLNQSNNKASDNAESTYCPNPYLSSLPFYQLFLQMISEVGHYISAWLP